MRMLVLTIAGLAMLGGLVALLTGAFPPALIFGFWGVVIVAGTLWERIFYKPLLKQAPGPGWQRTPERFVDPGTGQPVTVYTDPRTGERQYVQE